MYGYVIQSNAMQQVLQPTSSVAEHCLVVDRLQNAVSWEAAVLVLLVIKLCILMTGVQRFQVPNFLFNDLLVKNNYRTGFEPPASSSYLLSQPCAGQLQVRESHFPNLKSRAKMTTTQDLNPQPQAATYCGRAK